MVAPDEPALRFDVTTNDWVLFAPARARRPHVNAQKSRSSEAIGPCPFCPGNEHLTSDEVFRDPEGSGSAWSLRVIRNKFPALDPTTPPDQRELGRVFREMGGYGVHEVIIESPEHDRPLADQPIEQIERILFAIHARFTSLMGDPCLRAIVVFKNQGERAGTSLPHPHWQLIATPVVPRLLRIKHTVATDYFDRTGKCLYAVALEDELSSRTRVVSTNDAFVALLPYASHLPYQVRIAPRRAQASFSGITAFRALASLLKDVLVRLARALDDPDFNLTVNTGLLGEDCDPYFSWHIDVFPRLTTPAGFELGSGMAINPVLPEDAAEALRAQGPLEGEAE